MGDDDTGSRGARAGPAAGPDRPPPVAQGAAACAGVGGDSSETDDSEEAPERLPPTARNALALVDLNGRSFIRDAMKRFPQHEGLQEYGSHSLFRLFPAKQTTPSAAPTVRSVLHNVFAGHERERKGAAIDDSPFEALAEGGDIDLDAALS